MTDYPAASQGTDKLNRTVRRSRTDNSELGGVQQLAELVAGQLAQLTGLELAQPHRPDPGPGQPGDRVADVLEEPTDDLVAALVDDQLHDGLAGAVLHDAGPGHGDRAVVEGDAVLDRAQRGLGDLARHLDDVGLVHLVRGVRQPVGEVTVVGQDQQTLAVGVQPADVKQPLGGRSAPTQVGHRRAPALWVVHRGDHTARLVQCEVSTAAEAVGAGAIDSDHITSGSTFVPAE